MQTCRKMHAPKRLLFVKSLFDPPQNRHVLTGPNNPLAPVLCQTKIFDVIFLRCHSENFLPPETVSQSDVRPSRASGRTGNYFIYNETIPFVVRLSNHERNCKTVSCTLSSARRQFF